MPLQRHRHLSIFERCPGDVGPQPKNLYKRAALPVNYNLRTSSYQKYVSCIPKGFPSDIYHWINGLIVDVIRKSHNAQNCSIRVQPRVSSNSSEVCVVNLDLLFNTIFEVVHLSTHTIQREAANASLFGFLKKLKVFLIQWSPDAGVE